MYYKKALIPVLGIILCNLQHAKAQLYSDDIYWTDSWMRKEKNTAEFDNNGYILLKGSAMYNSTAVTNDFITQELYMQKEVSQADAELSVNRLKEIGRASCRERV